MSDLQVKSTNSSASTADNQTEVVNTSTQASNPSNKDSIVNELVGEGKKFKSVEALANGKLEADKFIESLKDEKFKLEETISSLKSQLDKALSIENLLTQTKQETKMTDSQPTQQPQDIASLVKQALEEVKQNDIKEQNAKKAEELAKEIFGDKATDEVNNRIKSLGLNPDFVKSVAMQSPEAYANLLGLKKAEPKPASNNITPSSVTAPLSDGISSLKSELDNLRKTDRNAYFAAYEKMSKLLDSQK